VGRLGINWSGFGYTKALKLVKDHLELIKGLPAILTPHEGELKIMLDVLLPSYKNIEDRSNVILDLAKNLDSTLLIKGPFDYISNGKQIKISKTGCAEMSVGGTGDILAGLCTCFIATKNDPFKSACSAAFLNGLIGEYCKVNIGERFTALDMTKNITNTLRNVLTL
jgi:NAD(P)H-hydrate epimerase